MERKEKGRILESMRGVWTELKSARAFVFVLGGGGSQGGLFVTLQTNPQVTAKEEIGH